MISISDMLTLLDRIPLWGQLKALPNRVNELEKRIAELESKPSSNDEICPKCKQKTFELISSQKDKTFGPLGVYERTYKCSSCGFEEAKLLDP